MPMENISRRTLLGSATAAVCLAALSKAGARPVEWKPRLGILAKYTEANVDFALQQEFNNMILSAGAGVPGLDVTTISDEEIARVKNHLSSKGMHVSALQVGGNHIAADPAQRAQENSNFVKSIELAGKSGSLYRHAVRQGPLQAIRSAGGRDCAGLPRQVFRGLPGAQGAHLVGALARGSEHCHQPGRHSTRCSPLSKIRLRRLAIRSISPAVANDGSDSNRERLR